MSDNIKKLVDVEEITWGTIFYKLADAKKTISEAPMHCVMNPFLYELVADYKELERLCKKYFPPVVAWIILNLWLRSQRNK